MHLDKTSDKRPLYVVFDSERNFLSQTYVFFASALIVKMNLSRFLQICPLPFENFRDKTKNEASFAYLSDSLPSHGPASTQIRSARKPARSRLLVLDRPRLVKVQGRVTTPALATPVQGNRAGSGLGPIPNRKGFHCERRKCERGSGYYKTCMHGAYYALSPTTCRDRNLRTKKPGIPCETIQNSGFLASSSALSNT